MGNKREKPDGSRNNQASPIKRRVEQLKRLASGSIAFKTHISGSSLNPTSALNKAQSSNDKNVIDTSRQHQQQQSNVNPNQQQQQYMTAGTSRSGCLSAQSGEILDVYPSSSIDVAFEYPNKIGHGFWLQRYSQLHNELGDRDAMGAATFATSATPFSVSTLTSEIAKTAATTTTTSAIASLTGPTPLKSLATDVQPGRGAGSQALVSPTPTAFWAGFSSAASGSAAISPSFKSSRRSRSGPEIKGEKDLKKGLHGDTTAKGVTEEGGDNDSDGNRRDKQDTNIVSSCNESLRMASKSTDRERQLHHKDQWSENCHQNNASSERGILSRCRNLVVRRLGYHNYNHHQQQQPTMTTDIHDRLGEGQKSRNEAKEQNQSASSWISRHLTGSPMRKKQGKKIDNTNKCITGTIRDPSGMPLARCPGNGDDSDNIGKNLGLLEANTDEQQALDIVSTKRGHLAANIKAKGQSATKSSELAETKQSPYKRFASTVMNRFHGSRQSTHTRWHDQGLGYREQEDETPKAYQWHPPTTESKTDVRSDSCRRREKLKLEDTCNWKAGSRRYQREGSDRRKLKVKVREKDRKKAKASKEKDGGAKSTGEANQSARLFGSPLLRRLAERVNIMLQADDYDTNFTDEPSNQMGEEENSPQAKSGDNAQLRLEAVGIDDNLRSKEPRRDSSGLIGKHQMRPEVNEFRPQLDSACKFSGRINVSGVETGMTGIDTSKRSSLDREDKIKTSDVNLSSKGEEQNHEPEEEYQGQMDPMKPDLENRYRPGIEPAMTKQIDARNKTSNQSDESRNLTDSIPKLKDPSEDVNSSCICELSSPLDALIRPTPSAWTIDETQCNLNLQLDSADSEADRDKDKDKDVRQHQTRVHIAFQEPIEGQGDSFRSKSEASSQGAKSAKRLGQVSPDYLQQQSKQAGSVGSQFASNIKRLIRRQQSVDSYRMARELKNKMRRQQEADSRASSGKMTNQASGNKQQTGVKTSQFKYSGSFLAATKRKASVCADTLARARASTNFVRPNWTLPPVTTGSSVQETETDLEVEPKPELQPNPEARVRVKLVEPENESIDGENSAKRVATPPMTLKFNTLKNSKSPQARDHPASFVVGSFSGSITPTYPTHHLPSSHYVPAVVGPKKSSNASTISSSIGGYDSLSAAPNSSMNLRSDSSQRADLNDLTQLNTQQASTQSDTDTSMTTPQPQFQNSASENRDFAPSDLVLSSRAASIHTDADQLEASLIAKRAYLAEHIYDNKCGLGEDMKFLASLPELCDITFLVGETREPVCAVKSVLAARSRVFHKILFGHRARRLEYSQMSYQGESMQLSDEHQSSEGQRDQRKVRLGRSPSSRSSTPSHQQQQQQQQQLQQQQWSVTLDASGYSGGGSPSGGNSSTTPSTRSGRVSASSAGRESSSSRKDSREPLIIGPGQTATPVKRSKKNSVKEAGQQSGRRLSRIFLKRISDSSIKRQHHYSSSSGHNQRQLQHNNSLGSIGSHNHSSYLDKMSKSQTSTTMIIDEFEPDVFRQLIEYIHTGCVLLQARTLLGLLNAADYYGLEQLRRACLRFVSCCITVDTVCSLLATAERYIQYKCTKSIVQKVLEFVDNHADEIFKLNAFGLLPEHVVRLILSRDALQADELVKYNGVYNWCEHYCRSFELTNIADVMRNFLDLIQFHKIPTNALLTQIYPSHIVPDNIFLSALAYQADPSKFEPQPMQLRRMTLPNPVIYKRFDSDDEENENDAENVKTGYDGAKRHDERGQSDDFGSSRPLISAENRPQSASPMKSSGHSSVTPDQHGDSANDKTSRLLKLRKGSIAQVSITGMMKLSHKLSIKRRQSQHRDTRYPSLSRKAPSIARSDEKQGNDPMLLGRQILDAFLDEQRQREAIEAQKALEQAKLAGEDSNPTVNVGDSGANLAHDTTIASGSSYDTQKTAGSRKQSLIKGSSSRKSFKDFKHISKRIFNRHSSSKNLQSQQSETSQSGQSGSGVGSNSHSPSGATAGAMISGTVDKEKKRNSEASRSVFKIKRSETVIETSTDSSRHTAGKSGDHDGNH